MCTSDDEGAGALGGALEAAALVGGLLDAAVGVLLLDPGVVAPDVACLLPPPQAVSVSAHVATASVTLRVDAQAMFGIPPSPFDCGNPADARPG
jgi:hypothetical protein